MANRQFYIFKFRTSRLKKFNYNIDISFDEAKELKEVIALADNQMLRSIRNIRKRIVLSDRIEILFKERNKRKRLNPSKENSDRIIQIQNKINRTMFVPDYLAVVVDHPSHYNYIFKNGLIVNGKTYKRLSCSAGQARVSTVILCNIEIIDKLKTILNNGRKLNKLASSKFNAYFGLAGSATKVVSEPRFIVVKDFIDTTCFMANYVTETAWDKDDEIDQRLIKDMEMNRTDGMGLISPKQSQKWADELGLDWIPSQWCIRQNFLKGMLCTFPIHQFCEEVNGGNYIVETIYKDKNGEYIKADLRDYDVIITESQFKLWDSFDSTDKYIENCHKNNLQWGVSQYTPREPKDILKLNYQFVQTLNLNQKQIEKLASQFVEWIDGVSYDNHAYMLLFLLGVNNTESSIKEFLKSSDNYWIKSLIINPELKNDRYIRTKIRELIKVKIKNACMGDVFVDGNFQVLVSDPYGFMQHVCGLEVTGLLKDGEFYSNYWNERKIKQVDAMRSPLTYLSEHVILNLRNDDAVNKWYQYCKLGIILNYHGHEVVNFGGADFDFDILATTSNECMIHGVYKDELPVVYNPPKPEKILFTDEDLYKADLFSFGSIIGSITNKGSNGYALLPNLEREYGKDSEEYKVTKSRLKQCCKAQSAQIDKAKIGREVKGIPKVWVDKQTTIDDEGHLIGTEGERLEKGFYNSILLNKYPYFFIYLYDDVKREYQKFYDDYDTTCHQKYRMSFEELRNLSKKTVDQKKFVDLFYKYMPVVYSESSMNLLCRYIESINFNINQKIKSSSSELIPSLYLNPKYTYTDQLYDEIISELKAHIKGKRFDNLIPDDGDETSKYNDDTVREYKMDSNELGDKLNNICSNPYIVLNCLVKYYYEERISANKDVLWSTYGKYIFKNVKNNTLEKIFFPLPDKKGDIMYLGKKYKMQEIKFE
ncbi:MAG: hypothetical protein PHO86_05325 [Bacilli bacterium]|nr:hypothetical protein [Bacilli bacterium]